MTWTQLSPTSSPSARTGFAFGYDKGRDYALLFGGYIAPAGLIFNQETWKWNGTTWTQLSPSTTPTSVGQSGISQPRLVWDDANQTLMLFYFTESSPHTFKTYLWTGTDWQAQTPAHAPAASTGLPNSLAAGVAEAPGIGNVVIFGGLGASSNGVTDMWKWDGTDWTQLSPATTPPARYFPFMTYDGQQVVMYGGRHSGTSERYDTYIWDGTDWTLVTTSITSGDSGNGSGFAYSSSCGFAVRFGGQISNDGDRTWFWDPSTQDWTFDVPSPTPQQNTDREGQLLVYDEARDQIVLFGGTDSDSPFPSLAETWAWTCPGTVASAAIKHVFGLGA